MVTVIGLLLAIASALLMYWAARCAGEVAVARRNALELLGSRDLADLFIFLDARALALAISLCLLVLPPVVFLIGDSALLATAFAAAILGGPALVVRALRRRRLRRMERGLPDALFALAALVRAGSALGAAVAALPAYLQRPLADEVSLLLRQLRMGVALEVAVDNWAGRVEAAEARAFASLLTVVHAHGGTMAPALEQLADAGRRRLAMEDRIDALTSQGRLQGLVVTLLPVGVALALWQLDPVAMRPLFTTTRGLVVCGVVALMLGLGWWGIRRIVDIRV